MMPLRHTVVEEQMGDDRMVNAQDMPRSLDPSAHNRCASQQRRRTMTTDEMAERNSAIFRRWHDGADYETIASEFVLSVHHIGRIVRAERIRNDGSL